MNDSEMKSGTIPVITASGQDKTITVVKGQGSKQVRSLYNFDNVFSGFSTQEEIFDVTLKPIINDLFKGYDSTIIAYGMTGTGKTYTMEGDLASYEHFGIIPRASQAIFQKLKETDFKCFAVSCSSMEIYNEELSDLLSDEIESISRSPTTKLEILDGKDGTVCRGLTERFVNSYEEILSLIQHSQQNKKTFETKMNKLSSRSHCIFTMRVQAKRVIEDGNEFSVDTKLHLVDLAGSECAKTAAFDKNSGPEAILRERERTSINRSLLTLGRVLTALKDPNDGKKVPNVRIPYRDSKLTRYLQESLGGRFKTHFIATISPSVQVIDESMLTLNYAQMASGIINKPLSMAHLSSSPARNGNDVFFPDSASLGPGVVWTETECRLQYVHVQLEEAKAALARKHLQYQEVLERLHTVEEEKMANECYLSEITMKLNHKSRELDATIDEKLSLYTALRNSEVDRKKLMCILEATKDTEQKLNNEATVLLNTLRSSIADGDILHKFLEAAREIEGRNKIDTKFFESSMSASLSSIFSSLKALEMAVNENCVQILQITDQIDTSNKKSSCKSAQVMNGLAESVQTLVSNIRSQALGVTGISPEISKVCSSIRDAIQGARCELMSGESALLNFIRDRAELLEQQVITLNTFNADYVARSQSYSKQMSDAIDTLKNRYSDLVSKASEQITKFYASNKDSRNLLGAIVKDWESSSRSALTDIESKSSLHSSNLESVLEQFVKGEESHKSIRGIITNHSSFVDLNRKAQGAILATQDELLAEQRQAYAEAMALQDQLQNDFIKNVMEGVQNLMKVQMDKVAEDRQNHFQSFEERLGKLVNTNIQLRSDSLNMFDSADGIHTELLKSVDTIMSQNIEMKGVTDEARRSLVYIRDVTGRSNIRVFSNAENASRLLTGISNEDPLLMQVIENLKAESQACCDEDINRLKKTSSDGFTQMKIIETEKHHFMMNEVIGGVKASFDTMKKERPFIVSNISKQLDEVTMSSSACEKVASEISQTIVGSSDEIATHALSEAHSYVSQDLSIQQREIDSMKEVLKNKVNTFTESSSTLLVSTMSNLMSSKDKVHDFARTVICVDKDVVEVDPRQSFTFSETFSSTPAVNVLIEQLNLPDVLTMSSETEEDVEYGDENVVRDVEYADENDDKHGHAAKRFTLNDDPAMDHNNDEDFYVDEEEDTHVPMREIILNGDAILDATEN